jgi:16S rRNA (guanine527-N7)-methyltransferase
MSDAGLNRRAIESIESLRSRTEPWVGVTLGRSADLGFLGGMPLEEQVDHALGFVAVAEQLFEGTPSEVVDLGSGGGLPGILLCSSWPDSHIVLLDSNERRTEFLTSEALTWSQRGGGSPGLVEVVRSRAEEFARMPGMREGFDLVTARSFGSPGVTAECASPLLTLGGFLVVSEPPEPPEGERWPADGLAQLGLEAVGRIRVDNRFGYQVLVKSQTTPDRLPRRVGIPTKRPLF